MRVLAAETVEHLHHAMTRDFRLLIVLIWFCTVAILVALILAVSALDDRK